MLGGSVRVQKTSESGREIVLYRIHSCEICVLTTACLLAYDDYSAEGITETAILAAAIRRLVFDDLVANSVPFRNFVVSAFSKRITHLFLMIDEAAFQRIEARLAQKLQDLVNSAWAVSATHQKLSVKPGAARGVVSATGSPAARMDAQSRGMIKLTDTDALAGLAIERA